jgi:hypothetical protein
MDHHMKFHNDSAAFGYLITNLSAPSEARLISLDQAIAILSILEGCDEEAGGDVTRSNMNPELGL